MAVVVLKLLFILKSIPLVPNSSPFSEKELFIPQYFFFPYCNQYSDGYFTFERNFSRDVDHAN